MAVAVVRDVVENDGVAAVAFGGDPVPEAVGFGLGDVDVVDEGPSLVGVEARLGPVVLAVDEVDGEIRRLRCGLQGGHEVVGVGDPLRLGVADDVSPDRDGRLVAPLLFRRRLGDVGGGRAGITWCDGRSLREIWEALQCMQSSGDIVEDSIVGLGSWTRRGWVDCGTELIDWLHEL